MNVHYSKNVPEEVQAIVAPLLTERMRYLPRWVHELKVFWDEDDTACCANMKTMVDYRALYLTLCPNFISSKPDERAHAITHEFCHAYTSQVSNAAKQSIDKFFPDGATPGTEIAKLFIDQRLEEATEDLAIMLESL